MWYTDIKAQKCLGENEQDHVQYRACSKLPPKKRCSFLTSYHCGPVGTKTNMTMTKKGANVIQSFWSQALLQRNIFIQFTSSVWSVARTRADSSSWENTGVRFIQSTRTAQNEHKGFQEWLEAKDTRKNSRQRKGVELTIRQRVSSAEPRWRRGIVLAGEIQGAWQGWGRERGYIWSSRTWRADAPGWVKLCDGKLEQGQSFVGIIGKLFVGNLRWSVRLEGLHRPCQQVCWRLSYSNGWGHGSRWSFLRREGRKQMTAQQ